MDVARCPRRFPKPSVRGKPDVEILGITNIGGALRKITDIFFSPL